MKYNKRKKKTSNKKKKKKGNSLKCSSKQKNIQVQKKTIFRKVVELISQLSKKTHFYIASFAVIIGLFFNTRNMLPLFGIKALLGFILYLCLSYTIIYIHKKNDILMFELTGDPQLAKCQELYTQKVNSNFNFVLCFIAGIYFVSITIILEFVEFNLIGIYCLFALFFVVFLAFIVFQQYICLLFLLRDIAMISPEKFYEVLPERTEWFVLLEKMSNVCRNMFIILGSSFILLFIIFSPVNSVEIIFHENIASSKFIPLLCTWIIILISIVFMIPFSSFVRSILLQKIYKNLISQSIESYNQMYVTSDSIDRIIYMDIILRLNDRKYKLQNSYTVSAQ